MQLLLAHLYDYYQVRLSCNIGGALPRLLNIVKSDKNIDRNSENYSRDIFDPRITSKPYLGLINSNVFYSMVKPLLTSYNITI